MIDLFASMDHYLDHLAPVWWALAPEERGTVYVGRHALARAQAEGLYPIAVGRPDITKHLPVLVASYADLRGVGRRDAIFVEHGAGQTYNTDARGRRDPSYSGGMDRDRVRLFLAPNERVHAANQEGTPQAFSELVGAPKLDWFHHAGLDARNRASGHAPTVAVSFHWDCTLVPETRTAWRAYDAMLPALVDYAAHVGWRLLGHGHPRLWGRISRRWEALGVELVPRFDDVLRRADLYVVDNSSTLYEFAALAGPVVVLNAPWYRRDVNHGLRFWEAADVGVQVDEPGDLIGGVMRALPDEPGQRLVRRARAMLAYPLADGHAAERAVAAIRQHVL